MKERIEHIMRSKNLTANQLADLLNVQRSGISHIISGRNNPSLDFVMKLKENFPEFNLDWLIFGKGPMTGSTAEVKKRREMDLFVNEETEVAVENAKDSEKQAEYHTENVTHYPATPDEKARERHESTEEKEKKEAPSKEEALEHLVQSEYKQLIIVYADDTFKVLKARDH